MCKHTIHRAGFSVIKIRERLLEEGIRVSGKSLYFLLKEYDQTSSVTDQEEGTKEETVESEHFWLMDEAMEAKPSADISITPWHAYGDVFGCQYFNKYSQEGR